jgi:hypothetical protein
MKHISTGDPKKDVRLDVAAWLRRSARATHLLLLTATPHTSFSIFALWHFDPKYSQLLMPFHPGKTSIINISCAD